MEIFKGSNYLGDWMVVFFSRSLFTYSPTHPTHFCKLAQKSSLHIYNITLDLYIATVISINKRAKIHELRSLFMMDLP